MLQAFIGESAMAERELSKITQPFEIREPGVPDVHTSQVQSGQACQAGKVTRSFVGEVGIAQGKPLQPLESGQVLHSLVRYRGPRQMQFAECLHLLETLQALSTNQGVIELELVESLQGRKELETAV